MLSTVPDDMVGENNEEVERWNLAATEVNRIYQDIKNGVINRENIDYDTRMFLRNTFANLPILNPRRDASGYPLLDENGNQLYDVSDTHVNLVEGRDWFFFTNRRGAFGIEAVVPDAMSQAELFGGVIHLWHDEFGPEGTYRDDYEYAALPMYQEDAHQASMLWEQAEPSQEPAVEVVAA